MEQRLLTNNLVLLLLTIFNTGNSLDPESDKEIKKAEEYFSNIPNIEPKYIINEGLSKIISTMFNGKVNAFPLYKISLTIDPKPVNIPWTLEQASHLNDTLYKKKYRYLKVKKSRGKNKKK